MSSFIQFPAQQLPISRKGKVWRKQCVDWGDSKTFVNYSLVRKSVIHKKINYDLVNGVLHMSDLEIILNPEHFKAGYIPDKIQHYPILNSKLNVLKGEESKRPFNFRVVVTNPNSISEIEEEKNNEINATIQQWLQDNQKSEEEASKQLDEINDFFQYNWKSKRERRANYILNHYVKELNIPLIFSTGFNDALTVGEEIYQCDIRGGEPTIERLNPLKVRVFKSGYSNRIEDADIVVIEDYWSPGKVIDTYYDVLSKKDIDYIENLPSYMGQAYTDSMDNIDERYGFVNTSMIDDNITTEGFFWDPFGGYDGVSNSLLPYDMLGNLRVLRVYWKSRRKIKKVKSYDPETGEEIFTFYPESYRTKTEEGEEEEIFYINQAWEGTKIGKEIYVNMRPRLVQYNSISNPSKCHFGIVGSVYNLNDNRPFSLVDIMKPYNYLYDVIHDRLNKLMERNWGTLVRLDFAKKPKTWDVEKWIYYAKTMGILAEDSFNEGLTGSATGKLAGALNNASTGVIPASDANQIIQYTNLLEYTKNEMSEVVGISKQREGQIANRETVGGVERATLQSSYITEYLFYTHEDVKRRALGCFLETLKIAIKGGSKKFQYILPDGEQKIIEIDGDEFSENDYGLVVDNSDATQELNNKLDMLAQAALQNQMLSFSTIMKLYNTTSIAEKERIIEKDEKAIQERQAQVQQQQAQLQQEEMQRRAQQEQAKMKLTDAMNQRDNDTRIYVAQLQAEARSNQDFEFENPYEETDMAKIEESKRQFNEKLKLDKEKFEFEKKKHSEDNQLKERISKRQHSSK